MCNCNQDSPMSMEEAMTPFVLYFGEMKLFLKNEAMKPYFKIGKMKPITPPKIILKNEASIEPECQWKSHYPILEQ